MKFHEDGVNDAETCSSDIGLFLCVRFVFVGVVNELRSHHVSDMLSHTKVYAALYQKAAVFRITPWEHQISFNPLNAELRPIFHLLASLGAHHILHVSRIRVTFLKPRGNFYVPPGLILKNSTWCSHCVYVSCTDITADSDFCLTQHLTDWFCVIEVESVYCAVRTDYLCKTVTFTL